MSGIVGDNTGKGSGSITTPAGGATISSSDPSISTNADLGTNWANSTTGDYYILTDATEGSNIWTNVDAGQDSIQALNFGGQGGGTGYGYRAGGYYPSISAEQDKYAYASDGNATAVTALTTAVYAGYGNQSDTVGYCHAGAAPATRTVLKHTFASNASATLGDHLLVAHNAGSACPNSSTYGYCMGGSTSSAIKIDIEKMAYASEAAFTNVGDCYDDNGAHSLGHGSAHSSYTHGYRAGGHTDGPGSHQTDKIEKFPFASDSNSALVASLYRGIDTGIAGASSITHGYLLGGHGSPQTEIDKFPFASDSASTDVGDLHTGEAYPSGTSSLNHAYMAGGGHPQINNIQKTTFSADANATDVGDLTSAKAYVYGFQD